MDRQRFDGVRAGGKRKRRVVYGRTKSEVLKKMGAVRNGTLPRTGSATVGQFIRAWLDGHKASVELTTWAEYEEHVRLHIEPELGA